MQAIFRNCLYLIFFKLVFPIKSPNWDPNCTVKWPNCENNKYVNTACKFKNCNPRIKGCIELPPDSEFRQMVLNTHNEMRDKIASGRETRSNVVAAANMRALSYDLALEFTAICHVHGCQMDHDECRSVQAHRVVGQNLAERTGVSTKPFNPEQIKEYVNVEGFRTLVLGWYETEIDKDDFKDIINNLSRFEEATGHLTALMSARSAYLGCARALHRPAVDKFTMHITCHYAPAGNVMNRPLYKKGPPCSDCPQGTSCNEKYTSLCGKIDNRQLISDPNPYRAIDAADHTVHHTVPHTVVTSKGHSNKILNIFFVLFRLFFYYSLNI